MTKQRDGAHVALDPPAWGDADLDIQNQRMAERQCRVGSPQGREGIVEYVYRARGPRRSLRCKVLMECGAVRYVDILDVYVR